MSAGGDPIDELETKPVEFKTTEGQRLVTNVKVGKMGKTLIALSRLNEAGYEALFTKQPHLKSLEMDRQSD